jgi:adhesin transport system membrane fusion protein
MNEGIERPLSEKEWALVENQDYEFISERSSAILLASPKGARLLLLVISLFVLVALVWASQAEIDEVTVGIGKVIPAQQLQVLQNLEGGIVAEVLVKSGDLVEPGDVLLRIDNTRFGSSLREIQKKLQVLNAARSRLLAEVDGTELRFPTDLEREFPQLVQREREMHRSRQMEFRSMLAGLESQITQVSQRIKELEVRRSHFEISLQLSKKELDMTVPLVADGAIAEVEVIRLRKSHNDLSGELAETRLEIERLKTRQDELSSNRDEKVLQFQNRVREQFNSVLADIATISQTRVAAEDRVQRTEVRSPVRGIVQRVLVNTITAVVQPGTDLVEIVPLDDSVVVEAKVRPTDIAFIRPGQDVVVKLTAYDFTVYGGLKGKLEHLSADAVVEDDESYYLVRVRLLSHRLGTDEEPLDIIPGMGATVDILTGKKTILDYLLKPVLKARSRALRER